jgi:DNA-binding NtrC family response regulator
MPAHGAGVTVLVVSHEPSLRETYAMLFQQAGYTAEEAEPVFSIPRLKLGTVGILVMDHTLSKDARQALVGLVRVFSPDTKTVALHASAKDNGADLAMDSREGAGAVLERVAALVP